MRAKGTLISEPRFSTPLRHVIFPRDTRKNPLKMLQDASFPVSRRKGSKIGAHYGIISVPLALRFFLGGRTSPCVTQCEGPPTPPKIRG